MWFAIPSLHRTLTCYSLPISRRTSVHKFSFIEAPPNCVPPASHSLQKGPMPLKKADDVALTKSAKRPECPRGDDQEAVDLKASPNIGPERLICEFFNGIDPVCDAPGCTRGRAPRRAQKPTPKCIANVTALVAGAPTGRLKRTGRSASTK